MRRRCSVVLAAALASTIAASAAMAQQGTLDLALFGQHPRKAVQEYLLVYGAGLGVADTADVGLVGDIDTTGSEREIFVRQQFRGIPVQPSGLQLHVEKATGEVTWARANWRAISPSISLVPSISADSAVAAVWQDVSCPRDEAEVSSGRLLLEFLAGSSEPHLTWEVYYLRRSSYGSPIEGRLYSVDAHTGAILQYGFTVQDGSSAVAGEDGDNSAAGLGVYPNPFNSTMAIRYRLDGPGTVAITVHNIAGQAVRHLARLDGAVGTYEVIWDGRDDRGHPVASGIYVVWLVTPSRAEAKRVTLLR